MGKLSSRWSEDTTFKFVCEYVKRECLWNIHSPEYKNKESRHAAYNSLEKAMNLPGFTEKEIKMKINNIRSTYSQELKKITDSKRKGGSRDGTVYVPSVKWFQLLDDSLRDINSELRQSHSYLRPSTEPLENGNIAIEESDEYSTPESIVVTADISQQQSIATRRNNNKRQRITELKTVVNQLKGIAKTVNAPLEENEFEVFGRNVGLQLKAMPLRMALESQQHIQTYLSGIRLQHLADLTKCLQPMPTHSSCADEERIGEGTHTEGAPHW